MARYGRRHEDNQKDGKLYVEDKQIMFPSGKLDSICETEGVPLSSSLYYAIVFE